jgi:hypothetical protein
VQFTWNGGRPIQSVLVWYVIALATLVEPTFYEACFFGPRSAHGAGGDLGVDRFWALFDFMTTATGLYARAILPDLAEPVRAFPLLGEQVLPPLLKGLFFAGMLATVMSTVDSYLFIAAQTLGHDIVWRLRAGVAPPPARVRTVGRASRSRSSPRARSPWRCPASASSRSGITWAASAPRRSSFRCCELRCALADVAATWPRRRLCRAQDWRRSVGLGPRSQRLWLGLEPIFPSAGPVRLAFWGAGLERLPAPSTATVLANRRRSELELS